MIQNGEDEEVIKDKIKEMLVSAGATEIEADHLAEDILKNLILESQGTSSIESYIYGYAYMS